MRIFVTGAEGFIGSHITQHLTERDHKVIPHLWSKHGNLKIPEHIPPDTEIVINAAGKLGTPGISYTELAASNFKLPGSIAEYCARRQIFLIHLSTPGVTGLLPESLENFSLNPWGSYEKTKAEAENILTETLPWKYLTILRPDFVYGPGDRHKLALWKQISKGWFPLIGTGKAKIRPTFVDDICRAVEKSLPGESLQGDLYNIAGPEILSIKSFVVDIAKSLDTRIRLLSIPGFLYMIALGLGPLKPPALTRSRYNLFGRDHYTLTGKAWRAGFRSITTTSDGIRKTTQWYVQNGLI